MGSKACLEFAIKHGPIGENIKRFLDENMPTKEDMNSLIACTPVHLTWGELFASFIPGTKSYRKVHSTNGPINVG